MPDADALRIPIEIAAPAPDVADGGASRTRIAIPLAVPPRCPRPVPGEIVVCAQNQEEFRLRPLPETYESEATPGEVALAEGVSLKGDLQSANVGGVPSNRIMARIKFRF